MEMEICCEHFERFPFSWVASSTKPDNTWRIVGGRTKKSTLLHIFMWLMNPLLNGFSVVKFQMKIAKLLQSQILLCICPFTNDMDCVLYLSEIIISNDDRRRTEWFANCNRDFFHLVSCVLRTHVESIRLKTLIYKLIITFSQIEKENKKKEDGNKQVDS